MFCLYVNGICIVCDSIESAVNDHFCDIELPIGEATEIDDEEVVSTFFGDLS